LIGLLLAAAVGLARPALACPNAELPPTGVNNVWYCANASDTVVVFVHGFLGGSRTTWLSEATSGPEKSRYWPQLVLDDPRLGQPSVFLGGFYTEFTSGDFDIGDAREELLARLSKSVDGQPAVLDKKTIVFVAHSLGGVVVRDLLSKRPEDFAGKRVGLLLVDSPSEGSWYANFVASFPTQLNNKLLAQLKTDSDYLRIVHENFLLMVQQRKISSLAGKELVANFLLDPAKMKSAGSQSGFWGAIQGITDKAVSLINVVGPEVVSQASAARYFPPHYKVGNADHQTIATPTSLNHGSHDQLFGLIETLRNLPPPQCAAPSHFRVVMDVAGPSVSTAAAGSYALSFQRLDQTGRPLIGARRLFAYRNPEEDIFELYPEAPFPCPGDAFKGQFRTFASDSFQTTAAAPATSLCFLRSRLRAERDRANLRCEEGQRCETYPQDPGMADDCTERSRLDGWGLIGPAHAGGATPRPAAQQALHWVVPSLAAIADIPAKQRKSYTEYLVRSGPLAGTEAATHVTFGIAVNGTEVHIDGWPPHSEALAYTGRAGLDISFALENLGFSGGLDGHERISVEVRIHGGDRLLRAETLALSAVSYRHVPRVVHRLSKGDVAETQGWYRPASEFDRFEIIMAVKQELANIQTDRREIDRRKRVYAGQPVVGVIRPPRVDNPWYGLTLGLKQPTGQVQATFTRNEAVSLCQELLADPKLPQWVKTSAYLYEFPPESFTEKADRGRAAGGCADL
jgi:pimeloyl-ACP methyl ester carboxylesterase